MKTGKLFAGVALATLTAACTNEVMQLEPQAPEAGNRPMVNVQLSFDEDAVEMGNGETRLEFDKVTGGGYQWLFADGDRIGGLLMDTWKGGACGDIKNFELVDYVHTNYAFIRQTDAEGNTKWVTPENAPVCEGNYFFYFPYNDGFAHRGYVGWDVNPEQKQYNEAGELFQMQAIKDNQKWIGYKFVSDSLKGKVNEINFDFVPVFAMPAFDFTNMTGMELTVNKLVVRCTSNRRPQINPSGTHDLMATTMALTPATRKFYLVNEGWESLTFGQKTAEMWKKAQSYTYNSEEDEQYVWPVLGCNDNEMDDLRWDINGKELFPLNENHTEESIRQDPAYEYIADFTGVKGGYKVEAGYHVQALLTMPGGLYAYDNDQTFEAYLYVTTKAGDDYVVRIDLGKAQTVGATNTSGYDDIVSGAANKFLKPGMITKYRASFDATAMQSYDITDFKVTSTKDLLWVLNEAEGDGIYDLDVTTSGSRVVLNDSVEKLLNEKPYIRLRVNGEITIGEDASENAINLLYFTNPNMKTKLNIVNKQVRKPQDIVDPSTAESEENTRLGNRGSIINVAEGAELQASGIKVVACQFNNNGTAVTGDIKAHVNNDGTLTSGDVRGDVENSGTMKSGKITGDVTNSGKLEATEIVGNVENNGGELTAGDVAKNVIINGGKLTVNKVTGYVENNGGEASVASVDGTVTNNKGTITLRGSEYKAKVTNVKEATMNITGTSTLEKELVNAGTLNANCDVTGKSAANNTGTINISKGKTFQFETITNGENATINVAEDAKLITLSNDDDKIVNAGTINNDGKAHNIKNDGKIVAGAKSYTVITSGEKGTVDNSKLGEVSYEKAPNQTVILEVADITGKTLKELDDMILRADANKLIIDKGTIEVGEGQWFVKGHDVDNNQSYFAKGIELGDVTINGQEKSKVVFYASDVKVNGRLFANIYTDAVFVGKDTSASTTMIVKGLLETADHATVRGTEDAKLSIAGKGEVHNSGLIKNAKKENFEGIWTGNTIK